MPKSKIEIGGYMEMDRRNEENKGGDTKMYKLRVIQKNFCRNL